jgi:hypothetical protein
LRETRQRAEELSSRTLEAEITDILAESTRSMRNRAIAAQRFGWDGGGGVSLQVVAEQHGLTRERVRQICSRVAAAIAHQQPYAPITRKAVEFIDERSPGTAAFMEASLQSQGLCSAEFRIEGLLEMVKVLGYSCPWRVERAGDLRLVQKAGDTESIGKIVSVAGKTCSRWGVATVEDIASQAARSEQIDFVRAILSAREDLVWLDDPHDWFWLRTRRNRLVNLVEKMLSVAGTLTVRDLRSGITRHHRSQGFAPPSAVLLEMCRHIPGLSVDGHVVTKPGLSDLDHLLGDSERIIVDVLKENGPVLDSIRLQQMCVERGMNRSTFAVYLGYSPVIERLERGVYALRGSEVRPGVVEGLMPKFHRSKVLKDFGWTKRGEVWTLYKVSPNMISTGTFYVPANMRRFVDGEFALHTGEGTRVGTVTCGETASSGLGTFFRRRGGEPGDSLLLVYDLKTRVVVVHLGGTDLLERVGIAES